MKLSIVVVEVMAQLLLVLMLFRCAIIIVEQVKLLHNKSFSGGRDRFIYVSDIK